MRIGLLTLGMWVVAPPASAQDKTLNPHQTGDFWWGIHFRAAPWEMLDAGKFVARTGIDPKHQTVALREAVADMKFHVFVPPSYRPDVPHGLIIGARSSTGSIGGRPTAEAFAKHRILYIQLAEWRAEYRYDEFYGIAAVLTALHNMRRLYTIDPGRIYLYRTYGDTERNVAPKQRVVWRDYGTRMAWGYPELFSGLIHTGHVPSWLDYGDAEPALRPPSREQLAAAKSMRWRFYSDERYNQLIPYQEKLAAAYRRKGLNADTGTFPSVTQSSIHVGWDDLLTHAEADMRDDAMRIPTMAREAERDADFERALLLWYRGQRWETPGADEQIARLRGILQTQTDKAKALVAKGDRRKGRKLASKIDQVFGIFAVDARAILDETAAAPITGDAPAPPVGD